MANKDKLLESAQKFLAKGQLAKAIDEYRKLVEAFPKDFRNRQKLAELLCREKRNDEAQPHYEAVAKNFTETGFYLKAIAIYKQMQKIEPDRADIYLCLAELNEKQGLLGNALNEYRNLIAFYEKKRLTRDMVGVLQKMLTLDPENTGVQGKLIDIFVGLDEQDAALNQFRALVKRLDGKGDYAKIVKLYEKFPTLAPDSVDHNLPLAEALLKSGQGDKSLQLLNRLFKQAPDHGGLLSTLIDCQLSLGNHEDARLACHHLLKEQPGNRDLRGRYVRICLAGGDSERALESFVELRESSVQPGQDALLLELAEALQTAMPGDSRLQEISGVERKLPEDAGAPPVTAGSEGDGTGLAATGEEISLPHEEAEAATMGGSVVTALSAKEMPAAAPQGLELDLDLDLGGEVELRPVTRVVPLAATLESPPAEMLEVPVATAPPGTLEMDLEFDLGGLEGLEAELPAGVGTVFPGAAMGAVAVPEAQEPSEPSAGVDVVEFPVEAPEPSALPADEASSDSELTFPDLGGMEFTVDVSADAVLPDAILPATDALRPVVTEAVDSVIESPQAFDILPETVQELPEIVPEQLEIVPEQPEIVPEQLEIVPEQLEIVPEQLEIVPEQLEIVPEQLEIVPEQAEIVPEQLEIVPEQLEIVPEQAEIVPEQPEIVPVLPETAAGIDEDEGAVDVSPGMGVEKAGVPSLVEASPESCDEPTFAEEVAEQTLIAAAELPSAEAVEDVEEIEILEEIQEVEDSELVGDSAEVEAIEDLDELEEIEELDESPVPEAEPIAPLPSAQQLRDELEEAEFFLRQGLFNDAERLVSTMQQRFGDLPELLVKQAEIAFRRQSALVSGGDESTQPDLMAGLSDDELLGGTELLGERESDEVDEFSLDSADEQDEDFQSHFDLGIAYKEMGLLEDAIAEFGKASRDISRQLDCLTLKGQCLLQMGQTEAAEATFKEALSLTILNSEALVVLRFELGLLYEASGRPLEALESYEIVAGQDLFFRDVTDKLRILRQKLGIDDQAIEDLQESGSKRDRISYI